MKVGAVILGIVIMIGSLRKKIVSIGVRFTEWVDRGNFDRFLFWLGLPQAVLAIAFLVYYSLFYSPSP